MECFRQDGLGLSRLLTVHEPEIYVFMRHEYLENFTQAMQLLQNKLEMFHN